MIYSRLSLMDSASVYSMGMQLMHSFCLVVIISIFISVLMLMFLISNQKVKISSSSLVEGTWTVLPSFFLFSLGYPSLFLLYSLEKELDFDLTIKAISHQWYWSYESSLFPEFDSYMDSSLGSGNRLLEVDNILALPFLSNIKVLVTSSDVIHSWALPKMFLKVDAVPSRLNTLSIKAMLPSSVYSQCSEICSINHSFMPISVEFLSWKSFLEFYHF